MRLCHVTLAVADIPRSRAFYRALGLTMLVDAPHYCRFLAGGDATLSIHVAEAPVEPAAEIGLTFESAAELDEKVAALRRAGVEIAEDPSDRDWLWREARVRDPDGHVLLLLYAGENRLNPPWRVAPEA